jgi:Spy/CpxP family protein refolding chaperone
MGKSMRAVIAILALAVAVPTLGSIATAKTCGVVESGSGCAMGGYKIIEKREGKMAEDFEKCEKAVAALYEKYETEFAAIHEKHERKIVENAEKIEALEREIDEITKADQPDLGRLESRLKEISDLRFERTKLRFRMHKEARAVVDEADRAALDRHFAMGVGCCGGVGMRATYHPGRPTGKFDLKACCPGHVGHASMAGPKVMLVGEKDGHAEIQVLDDVHGLLGCAPGVLGEKHIEVLLDEGDDAMRCIEIMLDDEDAGGNARRIIKRTRAMPGLETEGLEVDPQRVIKRIRAVPGGEADDLIWIPRGGSAGPF